MVKILTTISIHMTETGKNRNEILSLTRENKPEFEFILLIKKYFLSKNKKHYENIL